MAGKPAMMAPAFILGTMLIAQAVPQRLPLHVQGAGTVVHAGPEGATFGFFGQALVLEQGAWRGTVRAESGPLGPAPGRARSQAPIIGGAAAQLRWRWMDMTLGARRAAGGARGRASGAVTVAEGTVGLRVARRDRMVALRVGTLVPLGPTPRRKPCREARPVTLAVALSERSGSYRLGGGGTLACGQRAARLWLHRGPWQLQVAHQAGRPQTLHRGSVAYRRLGGWASLSMAAVAPVSRGARPHWMGRLAGGAQLGAQGIYLTAATVQRKGAQGARLRTYGALGLRRPLGGSARLALELGAHVQADGVRPRLGARLQAPRWDVGLRVAWNGPAQRPQGQLRVLCRF